MTAETERTERDGQSCSACRGTGRVISNLGGEPHEIACPWCEGSGLLKPGHDAQEHVSEPSGSRPAPGHQTPENRS
jgi:DnaJ-class molecular chaperone